MYEGVNASDGYGIGVAQVAVAPDLSFTPTKPGIPEAEKARYAAALEKFVAQTNALVERMKQSVGEEAAAIMGAHIEFAEDEGIKDMVNGSIDSGMCARSRPERGRHVLQHVLQHGGRALPRSARRRRRRRQDRLLADLLGKQVVDLSSL